MDVFEAIKVRRSIRSYLDRPVESEKISKLLEAARLAPSAKNRQEWRFIVVTKDEIRERLVEACKGQKFVGEAPVIIVGIADPKVSRWYQVDMGIAMEHIVLEAVELGLGTCWIGAFYPDKVREILRIPEDKEVVALLTVGYSKHEDGVRTQRKSIGEIVCYEEYCFNRGGIG